MYKLFCLLLFSLFISINLSAQELVVLESKYLKENDSIYVFTPKNTISDDTPLLYLLHGWSGSYKDWNKRADIQKMSDDYGFIIITPDGFYNSWYLNNIDTSKMQWRSFFHYELYPYIKKRFNNNPDKTFITGLSMGGHGAINIFIDDTSKFKSAGSMSGVLSLHDTRLKNSDIIHVLGDYESNRELYSISSALERLNLIKGVDKTLVISCGYDDHLAQSSYNFHEKCKELGIDNVFIMSPGKHSWEYWIFALDMHLFHFSKILD